MNLADYRLDNEANGFTPNAVIYEVKEADELNPDLPVLIRLDVTTVHEGVVLSYEQPGPWDSTRSDMFINLESLVTLGQLAAEILATSPDALPTEEN
jgi:hypothetical protein